MPMTPNEQADNANSELLGPRHLNFREGFRFSEMHDMRQIPHFCDVKDGTPLPWVFFEPKPRGIQDDSTLEGCLRYAFKVETLVDKNNLYQCEACTEDKYGKSKLNP